MSHINESPQKDVVIYIQRIKEMLRQVPERYQQNNYSQLLEELKAEHKVRKIYYKTKGDNLKEQLFQLQLE